jgi:predicted component of type VI protein secretion system
MRGALLGPFGRYELGKAVVTLGRLPANTLVIDDNLASGRHAEVWPEGEGYALVDVGSAHGTTLNGQPLQPHALQPLGDGDVIAIGAARITVELAPVGSAFAPTDRVAPPVGAPYAPTERLASSAGGSVPTQPVGPANLPKDAASSGYAPPPPPPPSGYGVPPTPSETLYAPPPYVPPLRKSSKKKWMLFGGGGLALLVIGCACIGLLLYTLYTHSPEGVTNAYYTDIKSQDYASAYQLLASVNQQLLALEAQQQHMATGQQLYIAIFSCLDRQLGPVTAYTTTSRGQDTGRAEVDVNVTRSRERYTDPVRLLQENKNWKVAFFLPPPNQTCLAVSAGSAAGR